MATKKPASAAAKAAVASLLQERAARFMELDAQLKEQAATGAIQDPDLPLEHLRAAMLLLEDSPLAGEPGQLSVKQLLAEAPDIHRVAITAKTRDKRANAAAFLAEHEEALGDAADAVRTAREAALAVLVPLAKVALAGVAAA